MLSSPDLVSWSRSASLRGHFVAGCHRRALLRSGLRSFCLPLCKKAPFQLAAQVQESASCDAGSGSQVVEGERFFRRQAGTGCFRNAKTLSQDSSLLNFTVVIIPKNTNSMYTMCYISCSGSHRRGPGSVRLLGSEVVERPVRQQDSAFSRPTLRQADSHDY